MTRFYRFLFIGMFSMVLIFAGIQTLSETSDTVVTLTYDAGFFGKYIPCSSTSDQIGGLPRLATYIKSVKTGNSESLHISTGNMLFQKNSLEPYKLSQSQHIARWMLNNFPGDVFHLSRRDKVSLGEWDQSQVNYLVFWHWDETPPFAVLELGDKKIGFIGLAAENKKMLQDPAGLEVYCSAINSATSDLRNQNNLWIVVGLSTLGSELDRDITEKLEGIDILLGYHNKRSKEITEQSGELLNLHIPGTGEYCGRLDLHFRDGVPENLIVSELKNRWEIGILKSKIEKTQEKISQLKANSEKKSKKEIKALQKRHKEYEKELKSVESEIGSKSFQHQGILLDNSIAEDVQISGALSKLGPELKAINQKATYTLLVKESKIHFAGWETCRECHEKQYAFIQNQKHGKSWETLVSSKSDGDVTCIGCHSAGFAQSGGVYHIRQMQPFQGVQCESCHGPGKKHAEKPNRHKFRTVTAKSCLKCHTAERSDERITQSVINTFRCPKQDMVFEDKDDKPKSLTRW